MNYHVETVFMRIFDIGRTVDFKRLSQIIPAIEDIYVITSRDTPLSIKLAVPYLLQIDRRNFPPGGPFQDISLAAKIYADGAITMIVRLHKVCELTELHTLRWTQFELDGRILTIDSWIQEQFKKLFEKIKPAVVFEQYVFDTFDYEPYAAFCVVDPVDNPAEVIRENAQYISAFLLGENPSVKLHQSQVLNTLGHPFSFRSNDLAIFDMDRCIIFDPERDYEDLLLIIEHANYQLLELRTLDKLLDRWIDEAENDLRIVNNGKQNKIKTLRLKLANLQALRFDALLILENLENSSKIIGDYYLGQVYSNLCSLLSTSEWEHNIQRRIETLESIYTLAKGDANERMMMFLEMTVALMIAVELVAFVVPLFQH
jgi:hypothetical protein